MAKWLRVGRVRYLHIEITDDYLAEDAQEEPHIEHVVFLDFMSVQCHIPVVKGKGTSDQIDGIAGEKRRLNRIDARIAVDLAQLGHDKVAIYQHIDDQAHFIQKV